MRISPLLMLAMLLLTVGSTPAMASPCEKTSRVTFNGNLGEPTVSGIFTTLERVSKELSGHREKIRVHKCALMKMTGTTSWKAASKKLPAAAASNPEVLAEIRKLRQSIPPKAKLQALVEEAREAKRKFDAMVEVNVPDGKSAAYLKNIEDMRGFVTDVNKSVKHVTGVRKKMYGIIQKNGG